MTRSAGEREADLASDLRQGGTPGLAWQTMMRVWSSRPRWSHLGLFFAAYLLGCGFAELIGIVPGTNIAIWPPGGVFLATLIMTQRRTWLWWTLAGCLAEMLAQLIWYHSPLLAGFIMYLGNALCAVVGASLVTRANGGRPVRLESLQEVLAFVVLGAGIAPIFSATVGAVTLDFFDVRSQTFVEAWPLWWIGDATGILLVAPLTLGILQNRPSATKLTAARWAEAGVLALVFLGVAALSLSGYLPYAYIIMPPLLWAAVRFEFRGAVIALTILALIATLFTISGAGQFAGDAATQRDKQIMLQLFLAISAFSALIVATISGQYQKVLLTLRESERRLQQMIDAVPVRIWSATPTGGPVYFNKRYQDHFRTVIANFETIREPRIETLLPDLVHPEDAPAVQRALGNCFETGQAATMRFRWLEEDMVYRWAECRVEPWRDQNGDIVQWYGVSLDVDDEVRAQEELRRAQETVARASQAASLAELSASIAHEVNQPLAAIVANSEACRRWLSAEPPNLDRAKSTVERIIRDANSAADVVSRIRALFRRTPHARTPENFNRVVGEVCRLLADETTAKGIRVATSLEAELPTLPFDRVQIQQVLVNLIRNAIDAMESTVERARTLQIRSRRDGAAIRVEVCDTGTGFEDAERVFDPFFTTKRHGMGMGLAICRSIIEAHGGRLWAANNETGGATVSFTLPVAASEVQDASRQVSVDAAEPVPNSALMNASSSPQSPS